MWFSRLAVLLSPSRAVTCCFSCGWRLSLFVLRTNAKVTPLQAVLRYRDLLLVEDLFRRAKAVWFRASASGARSGCRGRLSRGDVEPKVFDRELFDRAVGLSLRDRLVKHGLQFRIALAQTDGTPPSQHPTLEARASQRHLLISRFLGRAGQIGGRGHDGIDTPCREIKIMLLRGLVFAPARAANSPATDEANRT